MRKETASAKFANFLNSEANLADAVVFCGVNPLSLLTMFAASSPEGGALFVLTGRCKKLPLSGELASRSDD